MSYFPLFIYGSGTLTTVRLCAGWVAGTSANVFVADHDTERVSGALVGVAPEC